MRIASANLFCLNPRPAAALEAVARQDADVYVLIESVPRFQRIADHLLPPRRLTGLTRPDGMPVSLHAREEIQIEDARESGEGWLEASVGGLRLLIVHAVAPYLPWRWPKRERQLARLARRMGEVSQHEPGLTIGDFNTADFEPVWSRYEEAVAPWRRVHCSVHGPGAGPLRGTWPFGRRWSPVALDHALATPALIEANPSPALVQTFGIPWSDHRGLLVDLPAERVGMPADLRSRNGDG